MFLFTYALAAPVTLTGEIDIAGPCGTVPFAPGTYPVSVTVDLDTSLVPDPDYDNPERFAPLVGNAMVGGTSFTCDAPDSAHYVEAPGYYSIECAGDPLWLVLAFSGSFTAGTVPGSLSASNLVGSWFDLLDGDGNFCIDNGVLLTVNGASGPPTTVAQALPELRSFANDAFGSSIVDSGPARLSSYNQQARLEQLTDALTSGGCTDHPLQSYLAGAYSGSGLTGQDQLGGLSGSFDRQDRTFGATTSALGGLGTAIAGYAQLDETGSFLAETESGGFAAGTWTRVSGRKGIFMGVGGDCEAGTPIPTALDAWFDEPITGW